MYIPIFIALLLGLLSPSHPGRTHHCSGGTVYVSNSTVDPGDPIDPDDPNNPGDPGDDGTGGEGSQIPPPKP